MTGLVICVNIVRIAKIFSLQDFRLNHVNSWTEKITESNICSTQIRHRAIPIPARTMEYVRQMASLRHVDASATT